MGRFDTLGSLVSAHRVGRPPPPWRVRERRPPMGGRRASPPGVWPFYWCFITKSSSLSLQKRCELLWILLTRCWPMGNIKSGCSVSWEESPTKSMRGVFVTGQTGNKWRLSKPCMKQRRPSPTQTLYWFCQKPIAEWIQPFKEINIDSHHMIVYCWLRDVHLYSEHIQ